MATPAGILRDDGWGHLVWILSAVALLIVAVALLPVTLQQSLLREGAPIELLSAVLYFLGASLLLFRLTSHWPFMIVMLCFGLRELDMDKAGFTEGLLKSRQYVGDTVAMPERIISLLILLTIIAAVVVAMIRGIRALRRAPGSQIVWLIALGTVLGVTAKTMDGINRKLQPYNIQISERGEQLALVYEEVAELGMAAALCMASFMIFQRRQA